MEYEKIKQIMEDMEKSKLTEMSIDFPDGTKIRMKKEEKQVGDIEHVIKKDVKPIEHEHENKVVKSPMVGTFYSKPSPNSEPYVKIGQKVKKGDVLCIIEAMKLMNEIESEIDGEIKDILVQDEDTVEYGKPLFVIG